MISPELHTNALLFVWCDPELTEVSGSFCDLCRHSSCWDFSPAHKQSCAALADVDGAHADCNSGGA